MFRILLAISVSLSSLQSIQAQAIGGQTAPYAVVRLYTHGASETVVWTGQNKSYLLGCGHAFENAADRQKRMGFDFPAPANWPPAEQRPNQRLVAVDNQADLSLVECDYGDRKSTRLNSSHIQKSRMPSSA